MKRNTHVWAEAQGDGNDDPKRLNQELLGPMEFRKSSEEMIGGAATTELKEKAADICEQH